jgi:hypothetical protein
MDRRNEYGSLENHYGFGGPADGRGKIGKKVTAVTKATRAISAVVFFGIPSAIGVITLVGYGVHKAYKRITRRP